MRDDTSHSLNIETKDDSDKETVGKASLSPKGATPKPRSPGRGLYITAIVLGIIIVLLLALYIFLALTYKKPAHSVIALRHETVGLYLVIPDYLVAKS